MVAAMTRCAENAMRQVDIDRALLRFEQSLASRNRRSGWRRPLVMVLAAAAAVAIVVVVSVSAGLSRHTAAAKPKPRPASIFPKPTGVVPTSQLPVAVENMSVAFDAVTVPELVVNGVLWSVQNDNALVVRMDAATLRVINKVQYAQVGVHWRLGDLMRVGNVVVLPAEGYWAVGAHVPADSGDLIPPSAIARFDARTGRRLPPIRVKLSGVDVATPTGVWVQTDDDQLGLLDPTGSRIARHISIPVGASVAYAAGRFWAFDVNSRSILGIDPATGHTVVQFPVRSVAEALLSPAGPDALLVVSRSEIAVSGRPDVVGTYRFDARALRLSAGTVYGGAPGIGPYAWAVDGPRLWGAVNGTLSEFRADTMQMVHAYKVTDTGLSQAVSASVPITPFTDVVPVAANRLYLADAETHQIRAFDLAPLR